MQQRQQKKERRGLLKRLWSNECKESSTDAEKVVKASGNGGVQVLDEVNDDIERLSSAANAT
jgi:isochorismate hydrolase